VAQAELVPDLVAHDVAPTHQQVLFAVGVVDTVPSGIIPTKGESCNTLSVACPPEAEVPAGTRVQVLHCDELHGVGVARSILGQLVEDATLATARVLGVSGVPLP